MKPLESAATPGVVKVISELIDDETLSSGIFENKLRSTSVCAVGVFSRRSADPASTVTVSLAPLSRNAIFSSTGTEDRTSTSCEEIGRASCRERGQTWFSQAE